MFVFSNAAVTPYAATFDGTERYFAYFFGGVQHGMDTVLNQWATSVPDGFNPGEDRYRGQDSWTVSQCCYVYDFVQEEFFEDNFLIHNFDWDETLALMPGEYGLESYAGLACTTSDGLIFWLMGPNNLAQTSDANDQAYGKWFMRFQPSTLSSDPLDDMNENRRANHPYGINDEAWMAYLDFEDGFIFTYSIGRATLVGDAAPHFAVYDIDDNSWDDVDLSFNPDAVEVVSMCSFENTLYVLFNEDGVRQLWSTEDGTSWEQLTPPLDMTTEQITGMAGFTDPFGWRKLMFIAIDTLLYNIDTDTWEIIDVRTHPREVIEGLARIRPAGERWTD